MVIALIGESCTGKTTQANLLKCGMSAAVYTGSDYFKPAKTEPEAARLFRKLPADHVDAENVVVYVISERDRLALLPDGCVRILCTAPLEVILERFASRMHGHLPKSVAQMPERKHGTFDDIPYDLRVDTSCEEPGDICARIRALRG